MPYAKIKKDIDQGQIVIIDGGTGTELEKRGVEMDPNAWCGRANLDGFDTLVDVHSDYISAGAQIITTNTYASSRLMLSPSGLGDRTKEINQRAFEACATARDKVKRPDVAIAGSVSHAVPMIPGTSTSDRSQMPSETAEGLPSRSGAPRPRATASIRQRCARRGRRRPLRRRSCPTRATEM